MALDDNLFVTDNPLVTQPSWHSASRFFSEVIAPSTVSAYYAPLSMTSLMVDYAMGGRPADPRAFHRTNLALHVLNAWAILLVLYHLIGGLLPAVVGALLFGLHPLTVEPTASIGERKTLLAAFFAFLSLLGYLRHARGGRRRWLLASLGTFILASMAKPSVTTLPILLLLLDHWPLRRLTRSTVVEKWPFFLAALASSAITVLSVVRTWEFGTPPQSSFMRTLLQICYLLTFYLGKILWPQDLSCVYAAPKVFALSSPVVLIGVLTALGLTTMLMLAARRAPGPLTGWLFFIVALVPTFGILRWSSVIAYDRYVYFPMLGVVLAAGLGFAVAWNSRWLRGLASRIGLVALALVVTAAEVRGVRTTLARWEDSAILWRHIVAVAPLAPEAHNGLGTVLVSLGSRAEAIGEFRRAIEIEPLYGDAHLNLGSLLSDAGQVDEGIRHLVRACGNRPRNPDAACRLAVALKRAGRLEEAAAQLSRALGLRPGYVDALDELGVVRILQGRAEEGIALLRSALDLAPTSARPPFVLATALLGVSGYDSEVRDLLRQAVRYKPDWPAPYNELAWLLATNPDPALRDPAEALRLADRAVELTLHREPNTLDTQAAALASAGRFEDAARTARSALALASETPGERLTPAIRGRLAMYERREPYTAPVGPDSARGR